MTEQKGYVYLLQAMPLILQQIPDAELVLIGDGEECSHLKNQAVQLGIGNHVHFLGRRNDIPQLLSEMDVFVLPSLWEGLPTVILESMIAGTPVVATDIPGTQELVQDGESGWLVEPADPNSLALAIIKVLKSPADLELIKQKAFKTVDQFSIQTVSTQYEELYRSLGC